MKCDVCRARTFCYMREVAEPECYSGCVGYVEPERTCKRVIKTNERPGKTVFNQWYACSECERPIGTFDAYCASCGAKVEW